MAEQQQLPCVSKRARLTSAQKMRNLREKRKASDPEYKLKENARLKKVMADKRAARTELECQEGRKKNRDRMRLARLKEKAAASGNPTSTADDMPTVNYRSPQAYGKAVRKAERALPSSPRKRKAVVWGVATRIGEKLAKKAEDNMNPHANGLPKETVSTVINFYKSMDIVYTSPGIKTMTVWENGQKKTEPRLFLTVYLKEAYALFKKSNPDIDIGFSSFCKLRPKNVLTMKNFPSEQCKCRLHENFF